MFLPFGLLLRGPHPVSLEGSDPGRRGRVAAPPPPGTPELPAVQGVHEFLARDPPTSGVLGSDRERSSRIAYFPPGIEPTRQIETRRSRTPVLEEHRRLRLEGCHRCLDVLGATGA